MSKWDKLEDDHREYMLAVLRRANAQARLIAAEVETIGTSLKHKIISPDSAVKLMHDAGLAWLIEPLPGNVGQIAIAEHVDAAQ